jgi:hypothetical protein
MVRLYVIGLMVVLSFGQLHPQVPKESKQVLGKWTFTLTERDNKPVRIKKTDNGLFRVEGDSIVLCIQDEYGNYEPQMRFPQTPKKSGPNGLYYEWVKKKIDSDGDSVEDSYWIKFTDIRKQRVQISVGVFNYLRTESKGEVSTWTESFLKKFRNWSYGYSSTMVGQRVK